MVISAVAFNYKSVMPVFYHRLVDPAVPQEHCDIYYYSGLDKMDTVHVLFFAAVNCIVHNGNRSVSSRSTVSLTDMTIDQFCFTHTCLNTASCL